MEPTVLIVEDDARLAALFAELLTGAGYQTSVEGRGDTAVPRILEQQPDLVLLDINLPGQDGFAVCRQVRDRFAGRILMITARGEGVDELIGLEIGADDYLPKPVDPRRLLARIKALLRRGDTRTIVHNGALEVDATRRAVRLDGEDIPLKTAEFDLLWILANRVGEVVGREELHRALRGIGYDGIDRSVDLRVSRLRRALGDDPRSPTWLKTVHGEGYILVRAG